MKYSLFDAVTLNEDLPEHNLQAGMIGVIIDVYTESEEAYEVEFCNDHGETIEMLALLPYQISKI